MYLLCSKHCRSFPSHSLQNERLNYGSGGWSLCPVYYMPLLLLPATLASGLSYHVREHPQHQAPCTFGLAIQKISSSCVTCSLTSARIRLNTIFVGRFFLFKLLNIGIFSPNPHVPYLPSCFLFLHSIYHQLTCYRFAYYLSLPIIKSK